MSWSYASTSNNVPPLEAMDMFVECLDIKRYIEDSVGWKSHSASVRLHIVCRFIQEEMLDGHIRFANNADVKFVIYHLLAQFDDGEEIGRYFARSRHYVPEKIIDKFRNRLAS